MKKSSFAAMISRNRKRGCFRSRHVYGSYPEWGAFKPGLALGKCWSGAGMLQCLYGEEWSIKSPSVIFRKGDLVNWPIEIAGAMAFGVGMCFSMIWVKMTAGIVIGLAGIVILLCLIPLATGIKRMKSGRIIPPLLLLIICTSNYCRFVWQRNMKERIIIYGNIKTCKTNEKIAEALTEVFFNIEHSVVDRYTKIEDTF